MDKMRNLADNMDKTWNFKIYKISILYRDKFFKVLYSYNFRMPLASSFLCQNCLHYNLENGLVDLEIT